MLGFFIELSSCSSLRKFVTVAVDFDVDFVVAVMVMVDETAVIVIRGLGRYRHR